MDIIIIIIILGMILLRRSKKKKKTQYYCYYYIIFYSRARVCGFSPRWMRFGPLLSSVHWSFCHWRQTVGGGGGGRTDYVLADAAGVGSAPGYLPGASSSPPSKTRVTYEWVPGGDEKLSVSLYNIIYYNNILL